MQDRFDVVTFGEAMVLLIAGQPGPLDQVELFHKRTAGAETNVAIGLARLGLSVAWASRLGCDSMGRYLLRSIEAEGVDCSQVLEVADASTGMMLKGKVLDGSDPPIEYHRSGSAASRMTPADIDEDWLLRARHLHATGVFAGVSTGCFEVIRKAMAVMRAAGRTISFDPNLRPALWSSPDAMRQGINELASMADWVFPGLEEGRLLTGLQSPEEIAGFYLGRGARLVVLKLGAEGAYFDNGTEQGRVPACQVESVVDTVGAGDGFAVGVVSGLLEGLELPQSIARGAWIGAQAVQVVGDTEGFPSREALIAAQGA
ncbi:MAG: sugar kinase [Alcaligenaceae bacterium]|nr:sugar kinase [Alcaligenaceae bacterium]